MNEHRDIRGWLAVLILLGGGYLLTEGDKELRMAVVGLVASVISYYFGSSQSNKENRDTINKMVDQKAAESVLLAEKVPVPTPTDVPAKVEVVNTEPVDVKVVKP